MEYKNFYENVNEANLRLQGTIVLYDNEPYYIHAITDHKPDGFFRVYMTSLEDTQKGISIPPLHQYPTESPQLGPAMDQFVGTDLTGIELLRKRMDSKLFNKFRPFPMGMMNYNGRAFFLERRPNRPSTKQGLVPQAVDVAVITAGMNQGNNKANISFYTTEFKDCIHGDYPSPKECLEGLGAKNKNESVAFHRNFALLQGPIETLFLAYKNEVIGVLPRSDFSQTRLGGKFKHLKEATEELRLFSQVE